MFLEECKNIVKEKNIPKYISDDIEISFSLDSTEKILIEKILMKKILMKKVLMRKNTNMTLILKLILKLVKNIFHKFCCAYI